MLTKPAFDLYWSLLWDAKETKYLELENCFQSSTPFMYTSKTWWEPQKGRLYRRMETGPWPRSQELLSFYFDTHFSTSVKKPGEFTTRSIFLSPDSQTIPSGSVFFWQCHKSCCPLIGFTWPTEQTAEKVKVVLKVSGSSQCAFIHDAVLPATPGENHKRICRWR